MSAVTTPVISSVSPHNLISEGGYSGPNGGATQPFAMSKVGLVSGMGFNPAATGSAIIPFRLGANATLTTGLKVDIWFADDANNAFPGKVGFFDATIGPVTSGTSTLDENTTTGPFVSCTAVTASLTTAATIGVVKLATISIPAADMNSLAAGGMACLRIRRLGANASDTHLGRIVIVNVEVYDY